MRAALATRSADRMSGVVMMAPAALSGVVVFGVALPLALSSPFPTPRQGDWIIQATLAQPDLAQLSQPVEPLAQTPTAQTSIAKSPVPLTPPPKPPPPPAPIAMPGEAARIKPPERKVEAPPVKKPPVDPMAAVDDYLWQVYMREPVKKDNSGDFTWKDPAA